MIHPTATILFGYLLLITAAHASWPRWRGVDGIATWQQPGAPADLGVNEPEMLWRVDAGKGYGGITANEKHLFVLDRLTEPKEVERIRCLKAESGAEVWRHEWPVTYGKMGGYSTGPRSSVLLHHSGGMDRAYAFGATGQLYCFDAQTGKVVWHVNAVEQFGARMPQWGFAASPVILEEKLWIHVGSEGGSTLALDPATGDELFRGGEDEAGYCTPELISIHGTSQIIQWGPNHIMGLNAASGTQVWSYPYKITYGVSIAQPLIVNDIVLVSGYWHGTKAMKIPATGQPVLLWENEKELCGLMSSPLYKDGNVYLLDKTHGLTCFTLQDGEILWRDNNRLTPKDRNPHFSLIWLDQNADHVALLNANGELIYARMNSKGVEELARHQIIDKTWAHPAFVGNRVYARSDTRVVAWKLWPEP